MMRELEAMLNMKEDYVEQIKESVEDWSDEDEEEIVEFHREVNR